MAELQKIKRTLGKLDADTPQETLLVVDASTGSNALSQAREFHNTLGLTGLIVTKLDGSGKGGVVVAIQDELGIPTRFVGTGEKLDDFAPFDGRGTSKICCDRSGVVILSEVERCSTVRSQKHLPTI